MTPPIHLAIDAINIRSGGGLTHLSEILSAAKPENHDIRHITIWSCKKTATALPNRPWLSKITPLWAEASLARRMIGHRYQLMPDIKKHQCTAVFSPGGIIPKGCDIPAITMSQNLLPFEPEESKLFGTFSHMRLKMFLIRRAQTQSFKRAQGIIFLTEYAKNAVLNQVDTRAIPTAQIPHGIDERFRFPPRLQHELDTYTEENPFHFLYISILMPYKHQIKVAHAVASLRAKNIPISVTFIGASWGHYGPAFLKECARLDPHGEFLCWEGSIPFQDLHTRYHQADGFIFASSCENMPNILIEAMASGLPIACSNKGPMPEILKNNGFYFNPVDPKSIEDAILNMSKTPQARQQKAINAFKLAQDFTWGRCADETFSFIQKITHSSLLPSPEIRL